MNALYLRNLCALHIGLEILDRDHKTRLLYSFFKAPKSEIHFQMDSSHHMNDQPCQQFYKKFDRPISIAIYQSGTLIQNTTIES